MSDDVHPMAYFEGRYGDHPDPWGFDTRPYERRKHELTVALLPGHRHRRAIEPGCANGTLTERLAEVCDRVDAFDPVASCVQRARARVGGRAGVSIEQARLPEHWPAGPCDLVVLSEVAYYLGPSASHSVLSHVRDELQPGGTLVAVHWTGPTDYPRSADEVHDQLHAQSWLRPVANLRDECFVADVWRRT